MKSYWRWFFPLLILSLISLSQEVCTNGKPNASGGTPTPTLTGVNCSIGIPTTTLTPTCTPTPLPTVGSIQLGGTTYGIAAHPRLNMTPDRLTALRARAVAGKTLYDALATNNDGFAASCSNPTFSDAPLYQLAVGYLAKPSKTAWRDCAKTYFNKIKTLTTAFNVQDYGRMDLAEWAYDYDFLYNDLTDQERSDFRDWVFNTWIPYIRGHAYDVFKGSGDCKTDPTHNLCITSWWGQYLFGLSCVGEDSRCVDLVTAAYDWYRTAGIKSSIDAAYAGCHPYSGSHYGRVRVLPYLLEIAGAEETALQMNASWMSWMDTCQEFFVQSWKPDFTKSGCPYTSNLCSEFSCDYYPGVSTFDQGRNMRGMLIPMERDHTLTASKRAQDWLKNIHHVVTTPYSDPGRINPTTTYGGKEYLAEYFLRYDQDAATEAYTNWPTFFLGPGTGQVFSRDAWGIGDKFWMESSGTSWIGDHQTTGTGGFKIFKNGEYGIVENDTNYAAGNSNQTALASYQRSTLIMGDGMRGTYLTGGFGYYGEAMKASVPKSSFDTTYAYWQINMDQAYHQTYFPLDYARRNFFHLKPITIGAATSSVNYVVVLDGVDPVNSIAVTEQFYVPKTGPTVSDPDVSFTLTNTKTMIRRIYPTGGAIVSNAATDGSGASGPSCVQCGSGMARITNTFSASDSAQFLGVVISMQGTGGSLPTTTPISGASDAFKGVLIDDSNVPRVVLAPVGNGTVSGTFTFTASPSHAAEYIISGLTPGTIYSIEKAASTYTVTAGAGTCTADSSGVLRWTD
ncbi:MAG: DUF4402 domain-containing protein [Pseudomonadota bacterium]